jgi:hypothetical protein
LSVKLHAPQEEAVAKMHNGCILYGDVGVGKTITSLAYYYVRVCGGTLNQWGSMSSPRHLYVITTAKVRDSKAFELQAGKMGIHTDPELSTNGVSITVDSWNNLHKYVEIKDAFFIFDEQRVVGYGAWSRAFIKVAKHNEWVLLSATPGDTWLDYIPVFIANGWYKHKTDFLDQHVIWTPRVKYPKVLRYQNVIALVRRRNEVLVRMPYERHTKRHAVDVVCGYDEETFERAVKKRWHVYENRPLRDVSELFGVMRKVVNSDPSRLDAMRELLTRHPKLIVFYNFDYELEMLRSLGDAHPDTAVVVTEPNGGPASSVSPFTIPNQSDSTETSFHSNGSSHETKSSTTQDGCSPGSKTSSTTQEADSSQNGSGKSSTGTFSVAEWEGVTAAESTDQKLSATNPTAQFAIAEWNGHKHQEIPQTERWLYLVQYRAGAEGWNCTETDAIVFWSQTYSYRDWHQAHGRIDRINTPFTDLYYYHFISKSVIDKAIRAALRVKKNFNERDLKLGETRC